ncbi:MAG TPA: hypothetical protein VNO55_18845 [Polyangia bacterium]|nr:hypothetical protein [Polyangia bacterium]
MIELSDEARAVMDAGRHLDNPTAAARARARRAVAARIAAAGAAGAVSTSAAAAAAAVPVFKIVLSAVLVVAGGVGGGVWWHVAHQAPEAARPAALTAPAAAPAAAAPSAFEAPAAERSSAATPPVRPAWRTHRATRALAHAKASGRSLAAPPPGDSLRAETALLAGANAALRAGDVARGLALLDDYDRRFPGGALREETAATRIIARCQTGDGAAATAARRFMEQHPSSPLSSRLSSSCLTEPAR